MVDWLWLVFILVDTNFHWFSDTLGLVINDGMGGVGQGIQKWRMSSYTVSLT